MGTGWKNMESAGHFRGHQAFCFVVLLFIGSLLCVCLFLCLGVVAFVFTACCVGVCLCVLLRVVLFVLWFSVDLKFER